MVADIVTRETEWAEVMFIVAMVLAFVAAFMAWPQRTVTNVCGWAAIAAVAFGLLLL